MLYYVGDLCVFLLQHLEKDSRKYLEINFVFMTGIPRQGESDISRYIGFPTKLNHSLNRADTRDVTENDLSRFREEIFDLKVGFMLMYSPASKTAGTSNVFQLLHSAIENILILICLIDKSIIIDYARRTLPARDSKLSVTVFSFL